MKNQSKLPETPKNKLVSKSGEISLFKLSNDKPLEPEDAPYIKDQLKSFLVVDKGDSQTNTLVVKLFLESIYEQGMGKKQFIRALKHAFKTPTYGNKDFLSKILSFDKTIKTFSYNGILKLIKDELISGTSEMIKVQFNNGVKSHIYKTDFVEGLMIIAEPTKPEDKKERYYIDPKTKEKFIV